MLFIRDLSVDIAQVHQLGGAVAVHQQAGENSRIEAVRAFPPAPGLRREARTKSRLHHGA
ncbi:MAG: hypothetical protein A2Z45_03155 [Chloroflexi bacterium RBG_19FT_COMBO_55_16]|nr:MAG: hypothetical protein A2Z45_03155 [Chloroflexi bacterium RBG_19FT_COMBO_55_16]